MVDIIDVILAKGATPQGQIESYAAMAQAAVTRANAAVAAANEAVENIDTITQQTNTNNANAAQAIADANAAIAALSGASGTVLTEMKNVTYSTYWQNHAGYIGVAVQKTYSDNTKSNYITVGKLFEETGTSRQGSLTQKAITELLAEKADVSTTATKTYVDEAIAAIPSGGGSGGTGNLGPENAGQIVVVGEDGTLEAGQTTEAEIIEALIGSGTSGMSGLVGLEIDYENKTITRTEEARNYQMGANFDSYAMFGGRKRCNVADDGTITAFYGDNNYRDDGSNGQVMVYQPKFYYKRTIINYSNATLGKTVKKESLILSPTAQPGFKLHPLFTLSNPEGVDYVLLSAYEGSIYDVSESKYSNKEDITIDFSNDKLSSVAGTKPISGVANTLTITAAEHLANLRGAGWHITNLQAESAMQMLEMVEFGTLNGQTALEKGICEIPNDMNLNCASLTGSTANLGNATGAAAETINETGGTMTTYSVNGKRAISYRGVENPWGNIWRMVAGANVYGNGQMAGGQLYICTDGNYDVLRIDDNYEAVGFYLPSVYGWISNMGYGNEKYDWIYAPALCASTANSLLPVGDNLWTTANLNGKHILLAGGAWAFEDADGPFYYGADRPSNNNGRNCGCRLMFTPNKSASYYNTNITKWQGAN